MKPLPKDRLLKIFSQTKPYPFIETGTLRGPIFPRGPLKRRVCGEPPWLRKRRKDIVAKQRQAMLEVFEKMARRARRRKFPRLALRFTLFVSGIALLVVSG